MENKKIKLVLVVALIILVSITIYNIRGSFALFESAITVEASSNTGSWNIYINNTNISGATTEFTVNNINVETNNHVVANRMAPGTSAYFDLNIVPTGTDVSIKYDITFDFSELSTSLVVEDITELNNRTLVRTGENTYSGVITLNEIKNNVTSNVRVSIRWDNNENNNEIDTEIGRNVNGFISIPVQINVIQYLGERLIEYE